MFKIPAKRLPNNGTLPVESFVVINVVNILALFGRERMKISRFEINQFHILADNTFPFPFNPGKQNMQNYYRARWRNLVKHLPEIFPFFFFWHAFT